MFKKISFLFLLFIFSTNISAEIIKRIEIVGNDRISDETIKVYGGFEINKDYSEVDLNNALRDLYSTDFFENIEINLVNNILNIKVKEYKVINQLILLENLKKLIEKKSKN